MYFIHNTMYPSNTSSLLSHSLSAGGNQTRKEEQNARRVLNVRRSCAEQSQRSLRQPSPDDSNSRQDSPVMLAGVLFPSPPDSPSRPLPRDDANRPRRPMGRRLRRLAAIAIGRHRSGSYRAGVGGPRLAEAASVEVTVPSPTLSFP